MFLLSKSNHVLWFCQVLQLLGLYTSVIMIKFIAATCWLLFNPTLQCVQETFDDMVHGIVPLCCYFISEVKRTPQLLRVLDLLSNMLINS